MRSAPGRGVIPTLARAEWSLARSSGEVRAGCWAAMMRKFIPCLSGCHPHPLHLGVESHEVVHVQA